jgi:transposase
MVADVLCDYPNESPALKGGRPEARYRFDRDAAQWVRQDQIDFGQRPGTTMEESAQIKAMKKEITGLKRTHEILKAGASFFVAELDRPHPRS